MNISRLHPQVRFRPAPANDRVFHAIVDRILHLDRDDRRRWLRDVRSALDRFPAMASLDRRAFLREAALHDALNRMVFRAFTRFPRLSKHVARYVPIAGAREALACAEPNRPIILALMHFGPIHYVFTILSRLVAGRTLYALHAGGELGNAADRYLRAIGAIPMVTDERSLRTVARAMAEDPHCLVVISYDYLGGRARKTVPFLGSSVPVARGLAFLAEQHDALVVTAWGELSSRGPRVVVGGAYEIDASLPRHRRQDALTERLFALLEARVRTAPTQWTEWASCSARMRESA